MFTILQGSLGEAVGSSWAGSKQMVPSKGGANQEGPEQAIKSPRKGKTKRRPGDHVWGILCGHLGRGTGNTGKEVGLRGGFDRKLERISRIKLNEDIQHVGETKWFF